MATLSYLRFNHDYASVLRDCPDSFMEALLAWLANPTQEAKDELITFGVVVMDPKNIIDSQVQYPLQKFVETIAKQTTREEEFALTKGDEEVFSKPRQVTDSQAEWADALIEEARKIIRVEKV